MSDPRPGPVTDPLSLPTDVGFNPTTQSTGLVVKDARGKCWLVPFTADGWERRIALPRRPYLSAADGASLVRTLAALCGVPGAESLHVW